MTTATGKSFVLLLRKPPRITWPLFWIIPVQLAEQNQAGCETSKTMPLTQGFLPRSWIEQIGWYQHSWPARLAQTYEANGLVDIFADHRPFAKELLLPQLDTALVACEEISYNAMDPLGGGRGDRTRDLVGRCFRDRQNAAFNVHRLTVIGRKPLIK